MRQNPAQEVLTYIIADAAGLTASAQLIIDIIGLDEAPIAAADALSIVENNGFALDLFADNGAGPDIDFEGDLTLVALNGDRLPADLSAGFSTVTAEGLTLSLADAAGLITHAADPAFLNELDAGDTRAITFSYIVADDIGQETTGIATVTFQGVNDAPVAAADSVSVVEADPLTILPLADNGAGPDVDPEGGLLVISAIEGQAVSIGDVVELASGAEVALISATELDYRQNGAFDGLAPFATDQDSFNYTIEDAGGLTDTATVTVDIAGQTPPPVAADDAGATDEDTPLALDLFADNGAGGDADNIGLGLNIVAIDGQPIASGAVTLASGALLTLTGAGGVTYDPTGAFDELAAGEAGADSFVYTLADGLGQTDDAVVNLSLTGVNDAPFAAPDDFATDERTAFAGALFADNGAGPDSDVDGSVLTVTAINGGALGTLTLASGAILNIGPDGAFTYDPNGAFADINNGEAVTDSFDYTLSDGQGGEATETASIAVIGVANLINGTDGDDFLIGTEQSDEMNGFGGNDLITGLQDVDTLFGGTGDDTARGGASADEIYGGAGADLMFGEGGDDLLDGMLGDDRLIGGRGNDTLLGREGEDTLTGGGGDDRLRGDRDNDLLRGQAGADRINGATGDDDMRGGGGADTVLGGAGNDTLTGGGGRDTFLFDGNAGDDTVTDFRQGFDSIRIRAGASEFADISLVQDGANVVASFGATTITFEDEQLGAFDETDFIF